MWDASCYGAYCELDAGDRVEWNGKLYECRPWPYGGWCVHTAYEPGTSVGDDAWKQVGTCSRSGNLSVVHSSLTFQDCSGEGCITTAVPVYSDYSDTDAEGISVRTGLELHDASANLDINESFTAEFESSTQDAILQSTQLVASGAGSESMSMTVYLKDEAFDLRRLVGVVDPAARELASSERAAQLAALREPFIERVLELGGEIISQAEHLNMMHVELPAENLPALLQSGLDILGVELGDEEVEDLATGLGIRRALGIPDNAYRNLDPALARTGEQGSTAPGHERGIVRIGLVESDSDINRFHPAFVDYPGGGNRILGSERCTAFACGGSAEGTVASHSTTVAGVLLGSIEQGQVSDVSQDFERRQRSGLATESTAYYYRGSTVRGLANGIHAAVAVFQSDLINMSAGPENRKYECELWGAGGVRGEMRTATTLGRLVVVSAGNHARPLRGKECSINPFAMYPFTMAIGALDGVGTASDFARAASYSARGFRWFRQSDGVNTLAKPIDLVVGGVVHQTPGSNPAGFIENGQIRTSFAAPQVTGALAILKDWAYDRAGLNGLEYDPYILRTLLSVMGDGLSSAELTEHGRVDDLSSVTGFGRLRYVDLDKDLGKGGWWLGKIPVQAGKSYRIPIGSRAATRLANGWKFAAILPRATYDDAPVVEFRLVSQCDGQSARTIRKAKRGALKYRMRLRDDEASTKFRDKCLWLEIKGVSKDTWVYAASYFYTNERERHETREDLI